MKKGQLVLALGAAFLVGCGGSSSGGSDNGSSGGGIVIEPTKAFELTADNAGVVGHNYKVEWTLENMGECSLTGAVQDTVSASGSVNVVPTNEGTDTVTLTCGATTETVSIDVIPQYIDIPDAIFADALSRAGWEVTGGQMSGETALTIDMLLLTNTENTHMYGVPDEDGILIYENTSVPDYGAKIIITDGAMSDLTGLEYFKNLRTLRIEKFDVAELDVSGLTNLEFLAVWKLPIAELDVSKNAELRILVINESGVTSIDLSTLAKLEQLEIHNSEFEDVPYTTDNGVYVEGFSSIDFSKNPLLKRVYLHNNPLTDFGISQNKDTLEELWARNTYITNLDLSDYSSLRYIILSDSKYLSELNLDGVSNMEEYWYIPFRLYLEDVPNLSAVIVDDAAKYDQAYADQADAFWGFGLDPQIYFVDAQ